jgi:hypothetical protein
MPSIAELLNVLGGTLRDVLPIASILAFFQLLVLRRPLPAPRRLLLGFAYVLVGLGLFLIGLEQAIFPLGRTMAAQLTDPALLAPELAPGGSPAATGAAPAYLWVYLFAFAVGFSTTMAEPALIAVAIKARELSGGAIDALGLRLAVALGVAIGITLGVFRIVTGIPLHYFIMSGYVVVIVQTLFAPRLIVPLAYDSGGVTTSTVTVPLVAGLGLGLAESIPGRSPLIDGFGLIAFASLFPMITVMGYAQASEWRAARLRARGDPESADRVRSEEEHP